MWKRIPHVMTGLQQAIIVFTCLDGQLVSTKAASRAAQKHNLRGSLSSLHKSCSVTCASLAHILAPSTKAITSKGCHQDWSVMHVSMRFVLP